MMAKIYIGMPVADSIPGVFLLYYGALLQQLNNWGHTVTQGASNRMPLDVARQKIFERFLELQPQMNYDYFLWLDADMLVVPGQVKEMMDYLHAHADVDSVSALYFNKGNASPAAAPMYTPCAFRATEAPTLRSGWLMSVIAPTLIAPEALNEVEVDGVGMGCLLIRASSIGDKFVPHMPQDGRVFWFDVQGEDLNFCALMKTAGMRMVLLKNLEIPHWGSSVTGWHYRKTLEDSHAATGQV